MASRTIGFLDSYDILGKAIPGIVLLFGIILLLPASVVNNTSAEISIKNLAALFVASAAAGIVFGEGVHTLARIGERTIGWVHTRTVTWYRILYQIAEYLYKGVESRVKSLSGGHNLPRWLRFPLIGALSIATYRASIISDSDLDNHRPREVFLRFRKGIYRNISKFGDAFITHRKIFATFVRERSIFTRGEGPDDLRFKKFREAVTDYYDLQADDFREAADLYPLLSSHLDASSLNRARRFQGRYSFTRGMWLSTGILCLLYLGVYCFTYEENATKMIDGLFLASPPLWLALLVRFVTGIFLVLMLGSALQWMGERYSSSPTGMFLPWVIGGVASLVFLHLGTGLLHQISLFVWQLTETTIRTIIEGGANIGSIIEFLTGIKPEDNLYLVVLFGEGILGLILLLGISTIAFIVATGSYKRHYVEYTLVDTWESLKGAAAGRDTVISISPETMEQVDDLVEELVDKPSNQPARRKYMDRKTQR